jgi:TIR domain
VNEIAAKAFFSYAHSDNDREGGRILHLAELIRSEFETLTGTTVEIFTDSAEILWGQSFRTRLDEALQETTFFIPVLTPTYFLREECRKEMRQFVSSAQELGLQQLLLSIRYSEVPGLREDSSDELMAIAAQMQFEPWDDLRLRDESSESYRTGVNRLAKRLVALTRALENEPVRAPTHKGPSIPVDAVKASSSEGEPMGDNVAWDDDEPGIIDIVADLEPAITSWGETITALTPATDTFNTLLTEAAAEMTKANERPNSFAAKIVIARKLSADAEAPVAEIERLSKEYSIGLTRLDRGIRGLLGLISENENNDPEDVKGFVSSLRNMVESSKTAASQLGTAADAARETSKLSRDLRPVFRRYESAVRNVIDGQPIISGWDDLLDGL